MLLCSTAIFLCNSQITSKQVCSSGCAHAHTPADICPHCCHPAPLSGSCQPGAGLGACPSWAVRGSQYLFLQPLRFLWRAALPSAPPIWYHPQTCPSALCPSSSSNHIAHGCSQGGCGSFPHAGGSASWGHKWEQGPSRVWHRGQEPSWQGRAVVPSKGLQPAAEGKERPGEDAE